MSAQHHTHEGWQGSLKLTYGLKDQQTQLTSAYSQAPLKIQRPFYPEGQHICHSIIVHTAGGVVGGDRLSIDLTLNPKAHTLLTTSAAGKIYRSEAQPAVQDIQITVGAGAILEWLPQETILFESSNFHQTVRVELEPGAIWVGMDLFRFGRTARGEQFNHGEWRSHTQVWQEERPLWIDRSYLTGSIRHSPTTLGKASVMGTFVVLGHSFEKDTVAEIRDRTFPESPVGYRAGLSTLQSGIICRYLGDSSSQGRDLFLKIWESLRQIYSGCGSCIPRVWQV